MSYRCLYTFKNHAADHTPVLALVGLEFTCQSYTGWFASQCMSLPMWDCKACKGSECRAHAYRETYPIVKFAPLNSNLRRNEIYCSAAAAAPMRQDQQKKKYFLEFLEKKKIQLLFFVKNDKNFPNSWIFFSSRREGSNRLDWTDHAYLIYQRQISEALHVHPTLILLLQQNSDRNQNFRLFKIFAKFILKSCLALSRLVCDSCNNWVSGPCLYY